MCDLLSDLRRLADRLPEREVNRMVRQLQKAADEAGGHVTALQRDEVDSGSRPHTPATPQSADEARTTARPGRPSAA
ncbi:hypothetical protein AB0K68_35175 [Streptomyces sp. NPDC050698]